MGFLLYALGGLVGLYLLRKYRESKWGVCKTKRMMDGKIVVVTGANSGLGKQICEELARRKAIVVMACRDLRRAEQALADIRKRTQGGELIVMELDLGILESVRSFCCKIVERFDRIDVLINNAGLYVPPGNSATRDGFEVHMGVNHLGHFLLTNLLLELLANGAPSRVVVVSSSLYKSGKLDLSDINAVPQRKGRNPAYCNSKLANVLFALELARRVQGRGVSVNAVCPGWVYTGLFRNANLKAYQKVLALPVVFMFMRTVAQGVQTIIHCSVCEECEGKSGGMYVDCRLQEYSDNVDDDSAQKLWTISEKMVGLPTCT